MKKLLLFISLLIASNSLIAQFPGYQQSGSPTTLSDIKGAVRIIKGVIIGSYTDTTAANADYIDYYPFAEINTTSDGKKWRRNLTATKWEQMPTGSGGSGGSQTLQQVFDTEPGGSILNKWDTILVAGNRIIISNIDKGLLLNNITIGTGANYDSTNVAIGYHVLDSLQAHPLWNDYSYANTFGGFEAGRYMRTGYANSGWGWRVMAGSSTYTTMSAFRNAHFGTDGMYVIHNGNSNSGLGYKGWYNIQDGVANTGMGAGVGRFTTDGIWNTLAGHTAMNFGTTVIARLDTVSGGTGYTSATITISAPPMSFLTGDGTTATATAIISGGKIIGATITNTGSAYSSATPPVITVSGDGTGASLTAVLSSANENSVFGMQGLYNNDTGSFNVTAGVRAFFNNYKADYGVAMGYKAGYDETRPWKVYLGTPRTISGGLVTDTTTTPIYINSKEGEIEGWWNQDFNSRNVVDLWSPKYPTRNKFSAGNKVNNVVIAETFDTTRTDGNLNRQLLTVQAIIDSSHKFSKNNLATIQRWFQPYDSMVTVFGTNAHRPATTLEVRTQWYLPRANYTLIGGVNNPNANLLLNFPIGASADTVSISVGTSMVAGLWNNYMRFDAAPNAAQFVQHNGWYGNSLSVFKNVNKANSVFERFDHYAVATPQDANNGQSVTTMTGLRVESIKGAAYTITNPYAIFTEGANDTLRSDGLVRFKGLPSGKQAKQIFVDAIGNLYIGDSTGTGGAASTPTLQQVFDVQSATALLNKANVIDAGGFTFNFSNTNGVFFNGFIDVGSYADIDGMWVAPGASDGVIIGTNKPTNWNGLDAIAIGDNAIHKASLSSTTNIAIGRLSMYETTLSQYNVSIGQEALRLMSHATDNTFNVALGHYSLTSITRGTSNTAIGYEAIGSFSGSQYNTAVGYQALKGTSSATISSNLNTGIGFKSLFSITTGNQNTGVGANSQLSLTTGIKNTAVGAGSLENNTTGNFSTAVGHDAMYLWNGVTGGASTNDGYNVAVGWVALQAGGIRNTAVGTEAGRSLTHAAEDNVFLGYRAGFTGSQKVDAKNTIVIGAGAFSTKDSQTVIGDVRIREAVVYADSLNFPTLDRVSSATWVLSYDSATKYSFYVPASSLVTGSSYTFENGLTNTSGTVKIGGNLTGTTTIGLNSQTLQITGAGQLVLGDASTPVTIDGNDMHIPNLGVASPNKIFGIEDGGLNNGQASLITPTANDFDLVGGTLSIDYTNGQKATTSTIGFLTDTDWDTFNGKADYPSFTGNAGKFLKVNAVETGVEWATVSGTGTVTDFIFTDANGFDGTVTTSTSTPTLSLTTTVTDRQIMFSNSGAIAGGTTAYVNAAGEVLVGSSTDNGAYPFQVNGKAFITNSTEPLIVINTGTGLDVTAILKSSNYWAALSLDATPASGKDYWLFSTGNSAGPGDFVVYSNTDSKRRLVINSGGETIIAGAAGTTTDNGTYDFQVNGTGYFSGDVIVPDEAYDATAWNGSLEVPTKNAVRDKIEALGGGGLTVGTTTITSGTNTRVLYNNSGVLGEYVAASAATASSVTLRDANANITANNWLGGYTTTATAAGTTTLTVGSTYLQFFTGATTQIVTLPVVSTLTLGHQFVIVNNSTGAVTVNSSGGNAVVILAGGTSTVVTSIATTGTDATVWSQGYSGTSVTSGKKASFSNSVTFSGTDATTMTFPSTSATIARTDAAQTFTGSQTFGSVIITNNAITAVGNAATVPVTSSLSTVTNNSAATLTITMATASAVDGQVITVRILDFSAASQTITWVNTENSSIAAPTSTNGSTTLPLTVRYMYNSATSKWRCIGYAGFELWIVLIALFIGFIATKIETKYKKCVKY